MNEKTCKRLGGNWKSPRCRASYGNYGSGYIDESPQWIKKQYDRKYTFHPDNPKNDTLIPYNTKRRR